MKTKATMFNRKISRRTMLKGIGYGAGAVALAACGGAPAPTAAPAKATDAPKPAAPTVVSQPGSVVEVVHWGFSGGVNEATDKELADKFNAMQKEVRVNLQVQGNYEDTANKLTAALAAKQAPDMVLLSDVWWFKFLRAKALMGLNDLVAGEKIDTADFVPSLWNEGVRKSQQYWVPFARSTPLFYYNIDQFEKAGIAKAPGTWQELVDMAPKLIQKEGDTTKVAAFVHGNGASYLAWLFMCVAWQFGGGFSDQTLSKYELTNPDTIRAAQFYGDSVHKGKWAVNSQDVVKDFVSGLAATAIMSTGSLGGVLKDAKFKVGTAFLPMEKNFGCCTGGSGLAILTTTPKEKAQAAMKYISFLTGNDGGATWAQKTGYMPVRTSTAGTAAFQQFFKDRPQAKTAVDQLPKTRAQDGARVFIPGGDATIGKGLERITISNEDAAKVLAEVQKQLETDGEPIKKDIAAMS